jgi:class 3 adenylate cyclase/integral membrane sensor domain MASE1
MATRVIDSSGDSGGSQPGWLRQAAGYSLAYLLVVWLSYAVGYDENQVVAIWPPAGVMLFGGLRLGWRSVPLFWLLDFAGAQVSLPGHEPAPVLDALYALADVSALVAVLLLPDARRRFFGMFDSTAAMLWFLVAAAAISSALSVLMSMAMLGVAVELSAVRGVSVWDTGLRWFLGSYVGAVVVAPLLVAHESRAGDARRGAGAGGWHVAGAAALLALVLALAARVPLPAGASRFTLLLGLTPVLLWVALSAGPRALSALIIVACAGAVALTIQSVAPETGMHPETAILVVQVYLVVAAISALIALAARREQARLAYERGNLARFFSPRVVELVAAGFEAAGRDRVQDVAVLFVDIRGFTAFAEAELPTTVMSVLREFAHRVEDNVFAHEGTLDKYLGDGVMATFGVPLASFADARNALACARALLADIDAWNHTRAATQAPPIAVGIGIHFGPVVLGTIGSERTKSLSVLGDTVNTAARLQALSRELGTSLVVSAEVVAAMHREGHPDAAALLTGLKSVGARQVRGRSATTEIWVLDG